VTEMNGLSDASRVASFLGVSTHRVYALVREGRLPGVVRIGARQMRFDLSAIQRWAATGGVEVRPKVQRAR